MGRVVRGRRGAAGSSGGRGAGFGEGVGVWEHGQSGSGARRARWAGGDAHAWSVGLLPRVHAIARPRSINQAYCSSIIEQGAGGETNKDLAGD